MEHNISVFWLCGGGKLFTVYENLIVIGVNLIPYFRNNSVYLYFSLCDKLFTLSSGSHTAIRHNLL